MGSFRRSVLVLALVVAATGATLATVRNLPPAGLARATAFRSGAGGFELVIPKGWRARTPTEPRDLAVFERPRSIMSVPLAADAWMWIARFSDGGSTVAEVKARSQVWMKRDGRTHVRFRSATVGGREAVRVDHRQPKLTGSPVHLSLTVRRYHVPVDGQVYELGLSSWRGVPDEADFALRRAVFFPPTEPRIFSRPHHGYALQLPSGWNEREPTHGSVAAFNSPAPSTPHVWVYVFRFDGAVEENLARVTKNIRANGGSRLRRTAVMHQGRSGVRLDFESPPSPPDPRPQHIAELFVAADDADATLVLAVGRYDESLTVVDEVIAGFRVLNHGSATRR